MSDVSTQFKAARRTFTPLVAINTPDPATTMFDVGQLVNADVPLIQWDIVRGITALNEQGQRVVEESDLGGGSTVGIGGLVAVLEEVEKFAPTTAASDINAAPLRSVIFVHNAPAYLKDAAVVQGIWNVRDILKSKRCGGTLVLLGPDFDLPALIASDVLVLDEELPGRMMLKGIVLVAYDAGKLEAPDDDTLERCVDALLGLSAFSAEQATMMCVTREGVDIGALWERKRRMIEETPGLTVYRDNERFEDIGGVGNIKAFMNAVINGDNPPSAYAFIDEIEKAMGGATGASQDTSGTSQDQLSVLLTEMQDRNATGVIFVGPPGSAKSMVAKAIGAEAGVPTVQLDLGAMKNSLVGASEGRIRQALKVLRAVSNDNVMFIATSNRVADLPPELRRRFNYGTFFFDLPDAEERAAIWDIYTEGVDGLGDKPDDTDWTGAEIRQCVRLATNLKITLKAAAEFVVPVATAAPDAIEELRKNSSGKYISASQPGVYKRERVTRAAAGRGFDLEENA